MKTLKFFSFKTKTLNSRNKLTSPNYYIYLMPNLYNNSARIFIINNYRIVDKLGTINRDFNSNELIITIDYSKLKFWLKSGIRLSYKNYNQTLGKLGIIEKLKFF